MAEIKAFKYGIVYKSVNNLDIKLDLYLPSHSNVLFRDGNLVKVPQKCSVVPWVQ